MKIAITGASGLIGGVLRKRLMDDGHTVLRVGRYHASRPPDVRWSIPHAQLNPRALEGLDAVVHLAGEPVFGKWTPEKKKAIRDSRIEGTRLLAATLAGLQLKPRVFVSASAIGYYGDRGDDVLTEQIGPGEGFLAEVAVGWEQASQPAADAGIRVVNPRIGVVLSGSGGALQQMLTPFRAGLGGPLGDGSHWMSWISLEDMVRGLIHMIECDEFEGPVNLVAPQAVTNKQFTRALASKLHRPAILPLPRFAARATFGELADEVLFASTRVEPAALTSSGFTFTHPDIDTALSAALAD